ncbi:hypothetical protein CPC08DRAFT_763920 [Agrocybe pediades]|nr:hypothetical protein CPC08DRAFT_763920 [Agrocybe pediades]
MAEPASQEGTTLYKQGKLDKARECYLKAARLDKTEPKYPSNLSAVLYELGRYADCIAAIRQCWECLTAQGSSDRELLNSNPLTIKLATRFAKAKISGVAAGAISLHKNKSKSKDEKLAAFERDIEDFATEKTPAEVGDAKVKELHSAWEQWRAIRDACAGHNAEACKANVAAAASRLRGLPIYKRPADPNVEFYRFGHDEFQSMLTGMVGNPGDAYAVDARRLATKERWSFMFGGSGDARHVFATLIHFYSMTMDHKTQTISAHMTLIDIHPATLARLAIVLKILHEIVATHRTNDEKKRTELHTTLFYVYTAMLMPEYCRQIVMRIASKLAEEIPKKTNTLPKWLHINEASVPAIVKQLRNWSKPLNKSTGVYLERCVSAPGLSSLPLFKDLEKMMQNFGLKDLAGPSTSAVDPYTDPEGERGIYDRAHIVLPPQTLLARHPALHKLIRAFPKPSQSLYDAAEKEVQATWQPNPTLFDSKNIESDGDKDPYAYPLSADEPLKLSGMLSKYIDRRNQLGPVPAYAACSRFFELVAGAMLYMEDVLTIELIYGDATSSLPKLFAGDLGSRPAKFPKEYSRIFLSNVPDYTNGALNTAVQLVPYLERDAIAMANCLFNPASFRNIGEYCYNYALLRAEDFPRFLGCKVVDPEKNLFHDVALQKLPLPRPLDQLANKQELNAWLGQLLLCTLCPGQAQRQPNRIDHPNNMNAFLQVLVHLHRAGFPPHWISDFFNSVVSNTLTTRALPYVGPTPIPMSQSTNWKPTSRTVNLEPWQAELEVILALTAPALPFAISLPEEFAALGDIQTFKVKAEPIPHDMQASLYVCGPLLEGYIKALALMFYKPKASTASGEVKAKDEADRLVRNIASMFEGKRDTEVQFVLALEPGGDPRKGEISWKMSRRWFEKMKSGGWSMVVYRTDQHAVATFPIATDKWSEA